MKVYYLSNIVNTTFFRIRPLPIWQSQKNWLLSKTIESEGWVQIPEKYHNSMQKVPCYSFSNKENQEKTKYCQKVVSKFFIFLLEKFFFGSYFIGKWKRLYSKSLVSLYFLNLNIVSTTYFWFS